MGVKDVMSFTEACEYLGKSPSYFNNLVNTNKIIKDVDYRVAKGSKLVLTSLVKQIEQGKFIDHERFMDLDQFTDLEETCEYTIEDNGMSGKYYGHHWYTATNDETGKVIEVYVK